MMSAFFPSDPQDKPRANAEANDWKVAARKRAEWEKRENIVQVSRVIVVHSNPLIFRMSRMLIQSFSDNNPTLSSSSFFAAMISQLSVDSWGGLSA